MPRQIKKNIECSQKGTLTNIQWKMKMKKFKHSHSVRCAPESNAYKMFSQKVPTKLQKSHVLEALLVFSINPQKMQQKSIPGRSGSEIETQKI